MIRSTAFTLCAVLAIAAGALLTADSANAQSAPGAMQVVVELPADGTGTLAQHTGGSITVRAGETECASVVVTEQASSATLIVGAPEQPPVCRIEGVTLTLVNGTGLELFEQLFFEPGAEAVYTNLAPLPPGASARSASEIVRDVPAQPGVHLTVWKSGSVDDAAAAIADLASIWIAVDGRFIGFLVGAPGFANQEFLARYLGGLIPRDTLVALVIESRPDTSAPTTGSPWSTEDLLTQLGDAGISVEATGDTVACAATDGLAGVTYGGDTEFALWVYPTPEAVTADWVVEGGTTVFAGGAARHRVFECNRAPARILWRDNLVMWLSAESPGPPRLLETMYALLSLGGAVPPTDIHQFALVPPAQGDPLSASDLLEAIEDSGVTYAPYELPACPHGTSAASLQGMEGPLPEQGPPYAGFSLWVFPSVAALEAEWELGEDGVLGATGVHRSSFADCDYSGGTIHHNANMLLVFGGGVWEDEPAFKATIVDAFLALGP